MARLMLTGLLTAVLSAAALASEGRCEAPLPFAGQRSGAARSVRVAQLPVPDQEARAALWSALHRCVLPSARSRVGRGQAHRV